MTIVRGVRCSVCTVAWVDRDGQTHTLRKAGVYAEDGYLTVTADAETGFTIAYPGDVELVGAKSWRIVGADGLVYEIGQEGCGCRK